MVFMFSAIVILILFPMALYHTTKKVIKTAVASRGFLFPDFEKLNQVWRLSWDTWCNWGNVRRRIFYYIFYIPGVLLMISFDLLYLFLFFNLAHALIILLCKIA